MPSPDAYPRAVILPSGCAYTEYGGVRYTREERVAIIAQAMFALDPHGETPFTMSHADIFDALTSLVIAMRQRVET